MSMKCFCGSMMAPAVVDAYHTGLGRDFKIYTQQCPKVAMLQTVAAKVTR